MTIKSTQKNFILLKKKFTRKDANHPMSLSTMLCERPYPRESHYSLKKYQTFCFCFWDSTLTMNVGNMSTVRILEVLALKDFVKTYRIEPPNI